MSSTVPPAARIEELADLDTWDIPDLDEVDTSGGVRRLPARAPRAAHPEPALPGASTSSGAAPFGAAPVRPAKPKASESTAGAAAPPSSRVVQPPPLPGRRRSTPEAAAASSVARAPGEPQARVATPGSVKEWMRLERSAEASSSSPERGTAKARVAATADASGATSAPTSGTTHDVTKAAAAQPSRPGASGAAVGDAGDVPVARASNVMRPTERPQGTAVPPPANGATPPPLPTGYAAPPPLPAGQAAPPPLPAGQAAPPPLPPGYGATPARPHVTPAPETTGVPASRLKGAPASAPKAAPSAPRLEVPSAQAAPEPAAGAPRVPPARERQRVEPRQAAEAPAAAATAPVTEVTDRAAPATAAPAPAPSEAVPAAAPAKAVEPAPTPAAAPTAPAPAKAREAEPAPPAQAVEAPRVLPVAQVAAARALPTAVEGVTTAPVADAGWLAPITEPGAPLEDAERNEASVLFDFDADLLPSAGESARKAPGHGSGQSICTFWLGPDCYGLDVQLVSEVLLVDDILPVPWAPPALLGLINSRGRIVPVVSLATLLGVPSATPDPIAASQASPAILIKADSLLAAALVDRPGLVIQVDRAGLIPAAPGSTEPWVKGHVRPEERSQLATTLLDPERLVQRFLDVSRFPDIRSCLASGGRGPARATSAQHRGVEIP